jgi:predicted metalloprotease
MPILSPPLAIVTAATAQVCGVSEVLRLDDRLQEQTRGYVTPESFTHGSSAQRVHWFTQGFKTRRVAQCNTFAAP